MAKPKAKTITRNVAVYKVEVVGTEPRDQTASKDTERANLEPIRLQPPLTNEQLERPKR